MALAVSGAFACVPASDAGAQAFDPNSPAVRDAYVGPATSAKVQAALSGLNTTSTVTQALLSLFGSFGSGSVIFTSFGSVNITTQIPIIFGSDPLFAGSDGDLGAPGTPVDLTAKRLEALAGFTTAREFTVGSSTINTNAFNLTLAGVVTAAGPLAKEGSGILTLNGANVWNGNTIHLVGGTLRGSAASLASS